MGPISLVYLSKPVSDAQLDIIDAAIAKRASILTRTRKGRNWSAQIQNRPVTVCVDEGSDPSISESGRASVVLAAGCNHSIDYDILRSLSQELAALLPGHATEPTK